MQSSRADFAWTQTLKPPRRLKARSSNSRMLTQPLRLLSRARHIAGMQRFVLKRRQAFWNSIQFSRMDLPKHAVYWRVLPAVRGDFRHRHTSRHNLGECTPFSAAQLSCLQ